MFLQILDIYKHIIEVKKSDCNTLKEKEAAWNEICNKYNESALISQEVRQRQFLTLKLIIYIASALISIA